MSENFFDEQSEQSQIKAEIVSKYFWSWAKVIIGQQKRYGGDRIAYIDLFAGPGRYESGATSTPLLILETAIREPDFCQRLVAIFNDKDEGNTKSLEECIKKLPGIENLKHEPGIHTGDVGSDIVADFEKMNLIPTFFFIDPFGYKGLSLKLINSVLQNWGCDCVFFFNYNRISMGLGNAAVRKHMDALFGEVRAKKLRELFESKTLKPAEREAFIVEEMCQALGDMGGRFVLPFRFRNEKGTRTTHHLFFVSKAFRGYAIMKDIMAAHSSGSDGGVATFEYNPADERQPTLFGLLRPLGDLEDMLLEQYGENRMTVTEIFESHSVGKPFVLKNYKDCLMRMQQEGKIQASRNGDKPIRKNTFPEDILVTFKPA